MVANKPTIKDVARQAGVSIATVSRVMAKKANTYTPQTAQRVWDAAAKLGYQKTARPQNWRRAPVTRLP